MEKVVVTTSWDDGHKLDLKLADLLKKYRLAGTFYISPRDHEFKTSDLLSDNQIKQLSNDFEIGAHTITHPRLTTVNTETAREEIIASKTYLERVTGKTIDTFCYPGGDHNNEHKQMVKSAGFKLARTIKRFATNTGSDRFAVPTTLHAYRHWSDLLPILKFAGLKNFIKYYLNWDDLAIAWFDKVKSEGGVFHLWGHSWEIEKNKDWARLERVFKHISNQIGVTYKTNGELV